MTERRQAFRREPIEIDLGDAVISVAPVSWLRRNDFGNEVLRQHSELLNEAVQIYVEESVDTALPQIQARFASKFQDPIILLQYGLAESEFQKVKAIAEDLTFEQIAMILLAICDVNKMEQLRPLLDPNSLTPTPLGGILSQMAEEGIDIQKTESGQDSSLQESTATESPV